MWVSMLAAGIAGCAAAGVGVAAAAADVCVVLGTYDAAAAAADRQTEIVCKLMKAWFHSVLDPLACRLIST